MKRMIYFVFLIIGVLLGVIISYLFFKVNKGNFKSFKEYKHSFSGDLKLRKEENIINSNYKFLKNGEGSIFSGSSGEVITIKKDNMLINLMDFLIKKERKKFSYVVSINNGGEDIISLLKDNKISFKDIEDFIQYFYKKSNVDIVKFKKKIFNVKNEDQLAYELLSFGDKYCFKLNIGTGSDIYYLMDGIICPVFYKLGKKEIFYLLNLKLIKGYYFSFYYKIDNKDIQKYVKCRYINSDTCWRKKEVCNYKYLLSHSLLPIKYYLWRLFAGYFKLDINKVDINIYNENIVWQDFLRNYNNDYLCRPLEGELLAIYDILVNNYKKTDIFNGKGIIDIFLGF